MNAIVLIVEDDMKMFAALKAALDGVPELEVRHSSFGEAPAVVAHSQPDVIILDLFMDHVGDEEAAAKPTWDLVLKDHFCPVVIHSSYEEAEYIDFKHPYVRYERKNASSIAKVVSHVGRFKPQMAEFRGLRLDLTRRAGEALRETSKLLAESDFLTAEQEKVVLRSARRRVAASFDENGEQEFGWERYVVPPLSETLMMGDVLFERGKPTRQPGSFRLVMTPSCDLVPGRPGTATNALVASCSPFEDFQVAAGLAKGTNVGKLREKLPAAFNRDQVGGLALVPGLPGLFPSMCVDFRSLSLVSVADIAVDESDKPFRRVASMDSPFREKLMWGYVQVAGRPATPDLNPAKLLDEVAPQPAPAAARK